MRISCSPANLDSTFTPNLDRLDEFNASEIRTLLHEQVYADPRAVWESFRIRETLCNRLIASQEIRR